MKTVYKCNHYYKSFGLHSVRRIDELCPVCSREEKYLKKIRKTEEENNLQPFTEGTLHERYIASRTRLRFLSSINTHWLDEKGLFDLREALYDEPIDGVDDVLDKITKTIYEGMSFWYSHRNDSYKDFIEYLKAEG